MPSDRIACNFLIQSKLLANYKKPKEGGVVLIPGKNYAEYFCKVFGRFTQKPVKSTVTTHHHKHYDNNHTPKFNCIVFEFSNIFIGRIAVVV